ncbi:MAG TPA: UDP-N-acetylmuramoyl-tripeptide--D-alanyl-D-alanine ligase [Candidatus Nitrosotalea sp.]|nr:UDP-N-acetylmuramoyl-tripeptide--D-alanyl-D-alanine ligase [Candidatus Nitrosotalea sp.]
MRISLAQFLEACGGEPLRLPAQAGFTSVHTDSQQVRPGGMFFALKGAERDGHDFVSDALARGAEVVVVSQRQAASVPQVVVEDTWEALYALAGDVLRRVDPLVIGVTGSNGKTSTKELIAAALGTALRVHRSPGNLNTETGVPLSILGLEPNHQVLVLEMGMQRAGDIARLAALARPRVGVVTNIGSVHAEHFTDGIEGVMAAKAELLDALPADGAAVLNADDTRFEALRQHCRCPVISFGLKAGQVRAREYRALSQGCVFDFGGQEVRLGLSGRHQVANALAALAVAQWAGLKIGDVLPVLSQVQSEHRLQRRVGSAGYLLLDDSYNASPESMLAAFEVVRESTGIRRRLALLGEMRELGDLAVESHRQVGEAAGVTFDEVAVLHGGQANVMALAAGAVLLPDLEAARSWVRDRVGAEDLLLVKASHGVGLHGLIPEL